MLCYVLYCNILYHSVQCCHTVLQCTALYSTVHTPLQYTTLNYKLLFRSQSMHNCCIQRDPTFSTVASVHLTNSPFSAGSLFHWVSDLVCQTTVVARTWTDGYALSIVKHFISLTLTSTGAVIVIDVTACIVVNVIAGLWTWWQTGHIFLVFTTRCFFTVLIQLTGPTAIVASAFYLEERERHINSFQLDSTDGKPRPES